MYGKECSVPLAHIKQHHMSYKQSVADYGMMEWHTVFDFGPVWGGGIVGWVAFDFCFELGDGVVGLELERRTDCRSL